MSKLTTIITVILIALMTSNTYADVLIIDRVNKIQNFDLPKRGSTKTQVLEQFGEPENKKAAIGEPPISVWQYPDFSVYFERNWVINSVVLKASPEEKGPKSIQ